MEMREGKCPKCGNALQIPGHLEDFSCLYCGERLHIADLIMQTTEASPADKAAFAAGALHAAVAYPQSMEHMSKPLFFQYFDTYYEENRQTFEALARTVAADGGRGAAEAAQALLAQVERWFREQKAWSFKPSRKEQQDRTKFTIAIFLVPTVYRCAPTIAENFCTALRAEWLRLHPDSPFELATYETLAAGFSKHPFCFITTAVCKSRRLPDDCAMLRQLRAFRDGYLSADEAGRALIRAYYDTAPGIVARIDYCEDREKVYEALYRTYLLPCCAALRANEPERCRDIYIEMMHNLLPRGYSC